MFKKISYKIIIGITLASSLGTAGLWLYTHQQKTIIYDLNIDHDLQPILDMFAKDSYWLDAEYDTTQEKYRRMLKYGYVHDNPMYPGKLKFKVLRDKGHFIGFTAYYKTAPHQGRILFVAVHPNMRGKRYGETLVKTAIHELQKLGAREVILTTRVSNFPAQKLYNRCGMHETSRDSQYVNFGYNIP